MQRLTDVLGQSLGGTQTERILSEACEKPPQTDDAVYVVTIIVPTSLVMVDCNTAVIRVEVLARSEQHAIRKAGVSAKRG